jgi:hypothetical protein
MKNYIVEWFPKREIRGHTICFKNSKGLLIIGLLFTLFSITTGLLPLFGIGTMGIASWFNISVNVILLVYYRWVLFGFKKNDIGNGVPEKW